MRQETINLYKLDELSDDAQEKAISNLYNINVDLDWWEYIFEDAETIGLKIQSFDIDRANFIKGEFPNDTAESVAHNIQKNHGKNCETYKLAEAFLLTNKAPEIGFDENTENEFLRAIKEEYLCMLKREFEYLTSDDAIYETIIGNEYEFTIDGKLY